MSPNVLFVCKANLRRSPYAAEWAERYCRDRNIDALIDSAGLIVKAYPNEESWLGWKRKQVTQEMLQGADVVFAVTSGVRTNLVDVYHTNPDKVINIGVPDCFSRTADIFGTKIDDSTDPDVAIRMCVNGEQEYYFGPAIFDKILERRVAPYLEALKQEKTRQLKLF